MINIVVSIHSGANIHALHSFKAHKTDSNFSHSFNFQAPIQNGIGIKVH